MQFCGYARHKPNKALYSQGRVFSIEFTIASSHADKYYGAVLRLYLFKLPETGKCGTKSGLRTRGQTKAHKVVVALKLYYLKWNPNLRQICSTI